jgi:hypothetical protein
MGLASSIGLNHNRCGADTSVRSDRFWAAGTDIRESNREHNQEHG